MPATEGAGAKVNLDNSWPKSSTSRNYHHFFPRAYLRKHTPFEDWQANPVLNITLVSDDLNKRRIGAKPPSEYMEKFQNENASLERVMGTHLIGNLAEYGVWDDDYARFLERRGEGVLVELKERLDPPGANPGVVVETVAGAD